MNNTPQILIVDDTPRNISLLSRLLQRDGFCVLTAENGIKGYEMAVSQQPDLILLDIMMPGTDGYEVCRILKENEITSDIPVIFVTAKAETADKVKGLSIGGVDYITKPFQHAETMARVRNHLKLKAMHEENLEYQKELLRSQKMASITTLADGIAHNINNLIGTVIGYADMLKDNLDHDEKAHRYTDRILEAAQRVADLTQNLSMYARAGRSTDRSKVNVKELMERIAQLYEDKEANRHYIDMQISQDIPEIQASRDQMFQALSGIFVNAQEATPDSGTITIVARTGELPPELRQNDPESAADTYVIISISDTGEGMDEEILGRIFEPFFTTKQTVGAGLGLSATYGIIQKHKGAIFVDTKRGEGSTFHVYLPVARELSTIKSLSEKFVD